jgi:hypothetical protein
MGLSKAQATGQLNEHLTNIVGSYIPKEKEPGFFINDIVAQPLESEVQGQFEFWTSKFMEIADMTQSDSNDTNEFDIDKPSLITFETDPKGAMIFISNRTLRKREKIEPAQNFIDRMVRNLRFSMVCAKEYTMAVKITTAANYDSGFSTAIASGSEFSENNGDPKTAIDNGIDALDDAGYIATHIITTPKVKRAIKRHGSILAQYGLPTSRKEVSDAELQEILGLPIIESKGYYRTSAGVMTRFLSDSMIIAHMPPVSENEESSAFLRTAYSVPLTVDSWFDPKKGGGGNYHRINEEYTHLFTKIDNTTDKDTNAAYLITNCLA